MYAKRHRAALQERDRTKCSMRLSACVARPFVPLLPAKE